MIAFCAFFSIVDWVTMCCRCFAMSSVPGGRMHKNIGIDLIKNKCRLHFSSVVVTVSNCYICRGSCRRMLRRKKDCAKIVAIDVVAAVGVEI